MSSQCSVLITVAGKVNNKFSATFSAIVNFIVDFLIAGAINILFGG